MKRKFKIAEICGGKKLRKKMQIAAMKKADTHCRYTNKPRVLEPFEAWELNNSDNNISIKNEYLHIEHLLHTSHCAGLFMCSPSYREGECPANGREVVLNPAWQVGSRAWAQTHKTEIKSQKLKWMVLCGRQIFGNSSPKVEHVKTLNCGFSCHLLMSGFQRVGICNCSPPQNPPPCFVEHW
jgi:hypothetical protein